MKAYKYIDDESRTRHTRWKQGVTQYINDADAAQPLCTSYWFHFFNTPTLAAFMQPAYCEQYNKLHECEVGGYINNNDQTKQGCTELTLGKEIVAPLITDEQRVEIAIRYTIDQYDNNPVYIKWATGWLNNTDRTVAYIQHLLMNCYCYSIRFVFYAALHIAYKSDCHVKIDDSTTYHLNNCYTLPIKAASAVIPDPFFEPVKHRVSLQQIIDEVLNNK